MALDGRSVALDPLTSAVRADLADIRLADRVFAPHYAAPVSCVVTRRVVLRRDRGEGAAILATLDAGVPFEILDVIASDAWGIAIEVPLVGYVDRDALGNP